MVNCFVNVNDVERYIRGISMEEIVLESVKEFANDWKEFKERCKENTIFRSVLYPPEEWKTALDWERLLFNKILPHSDCLVISVAGGTNTGKSTIINVLVGKEISPVLPTASATKRPVMITSPAKYEQCLNGEMFPQFNSAPLQDVKDVLDPSQPKDRLFVVKDKIVEDRYILLDTPDVDSIRKEHWDIADKIISASDVVIAVLTEEKYNDFAVVDFFRRAKEEGKVIIPLMNKVNMDNPESLDCAREQLSHFLKELGSEIQLEAFYFPRTRNVFGISPKSFSDSGLSLQEFIGKIPLEETKQRVLQEGMQSVCKGFQVWLSEVLLKKTKTIEKNLQELENRVREVVSRFQPAPPKEIEEHLAYAIRRKLGWIKYTLLIPGSIANSFRREDREELYKLGKELRSNNEKLVVEMVEEILKLLSDSSGLIPYEIEDKFRGRLGEIITNKQNVIESLKEKVIKDLNLLPDEVIEELDEIADEFVNSNSLTGLKFVRAISALLFVLGAGVAVFSLMPGASLVPEVLAFGGTSALAYLLENKGFKRLQTRVKEQVVKWIKIKQSRVLELLDEVLFSRLFCDAREFVELSKEFAKKESVKNLLISEKQT